MPGRPFSGSAGPGKADPARQKPATRLRAVARHRVARPRPQCDRIAALVDRHDHRPRRRADVTEGVGDLEVDGVDTAITTVHALGAQLHGLAVGGNNDVIGRVAITIARSILRLIAADAGNDDIVDDVTITVVGSTGDQIAHGQGAVAVVWRPQLKRPARERDRRPLRVVDGHAEAARRPGLCGAGYSRRADREERAGSRRADDGAATTGDRRRKGDDRAALVRVIADRDIGWATDGAGHHRHRKRTTRVGTVGTAVGSRAGHRRRARREAGAGRRHTHDRRAAAVVGRRRRCVVDDLTGAAPRYTDVGRAGAERRRLRVFDRHRE